VVSHQVERTAHETMVAANVPKQDTPTTDDEFHEPVDSHNTYSTSVLLQIAIHFSTPSMSALGCSLTSSLCWPEALATSLCRKASRIAWAKPGLSGGDRGRKHVLLEEAVIDQGEVHCH